MAKPLFTVRDFRKELSDEVADTGELLRNYEFNISQGIIQRVSRFFDALALMDEPPARSAGGPPANAAPPSAVMNFGHKRSVGNQEKPLEATRKAAEQDAEMTALKAQVAELQAPAAFSVALHLFPESYYAPPTRLLHAANAHSAPSPLTFCRRRSSGSRRRRAETRD